MSQFSFIIINNDIAINQTIIISLDIVDVAVSIDYSSSFVSNFY